MNFLTDDDIQAAREWAATRTGCTCPTTFDGDRYVVQKHTCDYCREWDRKLTELGVSATPRPVEENKPGRRKYRRAA